MAFGIEARIGAILVLVTFGASAQTRVRHEHFRHGAFGLLKVSEQGISFTEEGKNRNHSRVWKYDEIQQLELRDDTLRILTYEDGKWALGRDREYVFDELPEGFSASVYPGWREKLDQRFIAAFADADMTSLAEFPAKLTGLVHGVEGTLVFGDDRIVFRTVKPGESRTWRFSDLENVASAGPFDFSILTLERGGSWNASGREFHFQLQRPMEEARFNEFWRRVNKVK